MSKEAYYFSHDSNANRDPKILKLRAKHGWEGYGIYWAIIETLREQEDHKWKASDKQLLSFCFANGEAVVNNVIDTCLDVGLLVIDEDDFIHSESLTKRMEMKREVSEKRRAAGRKGGSSKSQAKAKQNASKESKGKESKGNKNKSNKGEEDAVVTFEKNIGRLSEIVKDKLIDWCNDLGDEVVIAAIKTTVEHGAYNYSYVEKVLNEWFNAGLRDIESVRSYELQKRQNKGNTIPFKKVSGENNAKAILDKFRIKEGGDG